MPDPKTLLLKLTETAQAVSLINPLGGIPDDLTASHPEAKTQTAANPKKQTGTSNPVPKPGWQG